MDYRYETKDDARDFHKKRRAFIIWNQVLEFLPEGSSMSHFEFCESKGIDKETFNKITRGFYLNGTVVFYKDNFIYDKELIADALKYIEEISKIVKEEELDIYFGELPTQGFAYDYHYGKYIKGKIIKNDVKKPNHDNEHEI